MLGGSSTATQPSNEQIADPKANVAKSLVQALRLMELLGGLAATHDELQFEGLGFHFGLLGISDQLCNGYRESIPYFEEKNNPVKLNVGKIANGLLPLW